MLPKFLSPKAVKKHKLVIAETTQQSYPFYIKATLILLGIYLLFFMLQKLQDILVPIIFAGLIAILLNPLVNKLRSWGLHKLLAISIALLLAVVVFGAIVGFISSQLVSFSEFAPQLKKMGQSLIHDVQVWLKASFKLSYQKQDNMFNKALEAAQTYLGQTLLTFVDIIGVVVLLPIYAFLFLYYKPLFLNFFYEVFDGKHEGRVTEVLNETKSAIQSYIFGLLIEMLIVAALNSTALLLIGVQYAILLGVLGAILNMIPYIGGLVAIIMPMVLAYITGDGGYTSALLVLAAYMVIQFIDNNFIVPSVVSSKVEVNAFVSVIIVLLGGALWGVSGMFLSIPFIAICKIIFDRIDNLRPWGMLLGIEMDEHFTLKHAAAPTQEEQPNQA